MTTMAVGAVLRPTEPAPLSLSAEYYLKNRQFDRALELYRQLLDQGTPSAKDWEKAATVALFVEGRSAAQDIVQRYLNSDVKRTAESLEVFLNSLYGTFTTDKAQASYLQGVVRLERKDCQGAVPFFKQALDQDPTQLQVLRDQIECQARLENYPAEYEALKSAFALNPLSRPTAERLAEMHNYFGATSAVLDTTSEFARFKPLTPRLLVAQAISLARKTDREGAWQAFRKVDLAVVPSEVPAIIFWERARLLETDSRRKSALAKSQLTTWLKQFLNRMEKIEGFDPYRTASFRDEATKWLATLETTVAESVDRSNPIKPVPSASPR